MSKQCSCVKRVHLCSGLIHLWCVSCTFHGIFNKWTLIPSVCSQFILYSLQDGYHCDRSKRVALLEAHILEEQIATLGRTDHLERVPLLTDQVVNGVDVEG